MHKSYGKPALIIRFIILGNEHKFSVERPSHPLNTIVNGSLLMFGHENNCISKVIRWIGFENTFYWYHSMCDDYMEG